MDFQYQPGSWDKGRCVIAKIEWHLGALFPKIGFIVTNRPMEPDRVVRFYNQRGIAEQHIKEGKYAFRWTSLSCRKFRDNEARLQLHTLAYNLATFIRVIMIQARTEQKRQDRSARCADKRRCWDRIRRFHRRIRPVTAVCATEDATQGEKGFSSGQVQELDGVKLLGECRIKCLISRGAGRSGQKRPFVTEPSPVLCDGNANVSG